MGKLPHHVKENLKNNANYYSLYDKEVIRRCKNDEEFLGEVLLVNEKLIWHSVHKYIGGPDLITSRYCLEKDDILQLGRLGFIKAIYAFDLSRNIKFSSFGVISIVREIRCFIRDSGTVIRPTRTAFELNCKIGNIERELGYLPSISELADLLGEPEHKIDKVLSKGTGVVYMEVGTGGEIESWHGKDTDSIKRPIGTQDPVDVEEQVIAKVYVDSIIDSIRNNLTDKEIDIIESRLSGLNQTETAEKEGVSQMKVNRLIRKVAKLIEDKR